ncbi:MAG: cohesin domain-containing protein [bacterium]|nr:cohesin domain-containing protein [bacterium]
MAKIYKIALIFLFLGILPVAAEAATLYFSPPSGSHTVGGTFLVGVYVSSADQAMNAAAGVISFPQDKLEVTSLSKTGSIFNLWVQEPLFSNSAGTINFEGIVLNPGFTGSAGKIITINFRAKSTGSAYLSFSSGSVLANDGRGTNILTGMNAGNYNIQSTTITPLPESETEAITPLPSTGVPLAPKISSPTHPDPEKWYSKNSPEFTWDLPSGVTGVSFLLHEKPTANPGSESDGLLTSTKFENVEDGIWYFHITFRNSYGWGQILHRKVLIDTKPPEPFSVIIDNENDATNPSPVFLFETTDLLSGLEYYEVEINEEKTTTTPQNIKDNPYQPLPLAPGKYDVELRAYDKAENYTSASTEFEVLPIKGVVITKIPKNIRIGEILEIEGKAEPEIIVRIYIQRLGKEPILEKIKADLTGKFVLGYDKALAEGNYEVWAQAEDERGALSLPTEKYSLKVGLPPFLQFGKIALDYLTTMITLIVLIVGAIAVIFYTWYRISIWKKRVSKETKEVSQTVAGAFRALREEVEEQISMLDKKPGLTKGEKEIRDKLQEALDVSEKFIGKEIRDVEKELE